MWRPNGKEPRVRFWGRLLVGATSLGFVGWAWFFYKHVWQVAIPAFGSPEPYLAAIRALLGRYLAVGGGLLVVWWAGFVLSRSPGTSASREGNRQRQVG
ncbi:MAG: hypothetical protein GX986_10345 [Firmicutes bacterium]|nr:hypothetical protein [Bacillota bacterium]